MTSPQKKLGLRQGWLIGVWGQVGALLLVSVVGDGDDPLRPEPEDRVDEDDRHDEGQADEASAHHVDDQGLGEHLPGVGRPEGVDSGKGRGDVEPGVEEIRHPLGVGNAVVVVVVVVDVRCDGCVDEVQIKVRQVEGGGGDEKNKNKKELKKL